MHFSYAFIVAFVYHSRSKMSDIWWAEPRRSWHLRWDPLISSLSVFICSYGTVPSQLYQCFIIRRIKKICVHCCLCWCNWIWPAAVKVDHNERRVCQLFIICCRRVHLPPESCKFTKDCLSVKFQLVLTQLLLLFICNKTISVFGCLSWCISEMIFVVMLLLLENWITLK